MAGVGGKVGGDEEALRARVATLEKELSEEKTASKVALKAATEAAGSGGGVGAGAGYAAGVVSESDEAELIHLRQAVGDLEASLSRERWVDGAGS